MKLGILIPLIVAVVVLATSAGIIIGTEWAVKKEIEDVVFKGIASNVEVNARLIKSNLDAALTHGVFAGNDDGGSFLADQVAGMRTGRRTGYGFLVDKDGTFVAHPDRNLAARQFNPINEAKNNSSLKSLGNMVATAIKEKSGSAAYVQDGKEMFCAFAEIPGHPWILILALEKDEVVPDMVGVRTKMIIIGAVCMVLGIVLATIAGRSIVKPLSSMAVTMKAISRGDLTKRIKLLR